MQTDNDFMIKRQAYGQALMMPQWRARRREILERDGNRCRNCGSQEKLQVHHRQYHHCAGTGKWRAPWNYAAKYLITLCTACHKSGHQKYRVPIKTINQLT